MSPRYTISGEFSLTVTEKGMEDVKHRLRKLFKANGFDEKNFEYHIGKEGKLKQVKDIIPGSAPEPEPELVNSTPLTSQPSTDGKVQASGYVRKTSSNSQPSVDPGPNLEPGHVRGAARKKQPHTDKQVQKKEVPAKKKTPKGFITLRSRRQK